MADDEQHKASRRERRRAAKREKAERTGDSPEKRAEHEREHESSDPDVKGAATGAGIAGTLAGGGF